MSIALNLFRGGIALAIFVFLSACGGGGGSGGGGATFSMDTSPVVFSADINDPTPDSQSRSGSVNGAESTVYLIVEHTNIGIETVNVQLTGQTSGRLNIFPRAPNSLPPGDYSDTIIVHACLDQACNQELSGSPRTVMVTYHVTDNFGVNESELEFSSVFGSSEPPALHEVHITGSQSSWTAATDQSWLSVSAASGSGVTPLEVNADVTGLTVGDYTGTVTVQNTVTMATETVNVTLHVVAPTLTVPYYIFEVGGRLGLDMNPLLLDIQLDTGTNSYPWTATATTEEGNWMLVEPSGTVSGDGATISVDADRTGMTRGYYNGSIDISVDVNGYIVEATINGRLNLPSHKVYIADNGIAFTSTPSLSSLSRTIQVLDSFGIETPISLSSDSTWLSFPAEAVTGTDITVTADPTGLAVDTIHYATLQISSSDPSIENTETIRVGFWVGSTTPDPQFELSVPVSRIINDPIRPYVYVTTAGTDIEVYNIYTMEHVTTIANVATRLLDMVTDNEGSILYVVDTDTQDVFLVNLDTYEVMDSWSKAFFTSWVHIAYARPNGHGTILQNNGRFLDAATGGDIIAADDRFPVNRGISASKDGRTFCGAHAINRYFECYAIGYSDLPQFYGIDIRSLGTGSSTSFGQDYAFNLESNHIIEMPGGTVYDRDTFEELQASTTGFGTSGESTAGFLAGASGDVVYLYTSAYVLIDWYQLSGPGDVIDGQLVFSGDRLRVIAGSNSPSLFFISTQ